MYHKAWYLKTLSIFSIKLPTLNPNQTVDSDLYVVAVHIFSFVTSPAQAKRLKYQRNQKPMLETRIFSSLKYLSSISKNRPTTEFLINGKKRIH